MQKNSSLMTLKSYLDLNQLLYIYKGSHEENRIFALSQEKKTKPLELLFLWQEKNQFRVREELDSKKYLHYLKLFSSLFGFIVLIFGFTTGIALLSYSGAEPVNVIYLLLIMVGFPLLSMSLSLLSMLSGNMLSNFFSHLSPLYYLEKVVNFFPFAKKVDFSELPFSLSLSKWIFLQRVQLFSFLFSLGLFFSLLLMIVAKDIAFGWSTTLQVSPESFQTLLSTLALPWQNFFPSAVPSLDLVELSHYFRLGEKLDANMIQNADKLGAWWKFLAMATLVYALLLRLFFWVMTHYGFKRQLKKEFLALEGVPQLLKEFETPYVSTQAQKEEQHLELSSVDTSLLNAQLASSYEILLGWNFSENALLLVRDHFKINTLSINVVGGKNSFSEDKEVIDSLKGSVLLYVKAWEPPTMDFMDFLEEVLENRAIEKVEVCPLGTSAEGYTSRRSDVEIWLKKLKTINADKLGVIDV